MVNSGKEACGTRTHYFSSSDFPSRHPTDSTVFASAGADDQIALWDLALEKDEEIDAPGIDPELAVNNK